MTTRQLAPLPPPAPGDVAGALAAVAAALDGPGPALVPVPAPGNATGPGAADLGPVQVGDDEPPAVIVPTSGSTGVPKDVLLPAAALLHSARAALDRLGGPGRWLLALPTTSIAGLSVLVRSVVAGTEPVVLPPADGFTAESFVRATGDVTARGSRTYTALVPTQLWRLAAGPPDGLAALASYDAVLVGGAAVDGQLLETVRAAGVRVVRSYGMTETCGGCVYDGRPLDGVTVRAPSGGAIELGGPVVFTGYRGKDGPTSALRVEDGVRWHVTQDAGSIDAEGRLHVSGRLDDVIITGGVNVAARAVQQVIAGAPGVAEVVVLGVPDEEWGQRVVAFVLADRPVEPTLAELRAYARPALPTAALPRQLLIMDDLPLVAPGKVDRTTLRQIALDAWPTTFS